MLGDLVEHRRCRRPSRGGSLRAGDKAARQGFQTVHRVAIAAPGRLAGQRLRPRPLPGRAEIGVEGIESEMEVVGESADQGRLRRRRAARQPRQGQQQVELRLARGRCPEDVQPAADLPLLELAEIGVELGQCRLDAFRGGDAAILGDTRRPGDIEDAPRQGLHPPRVAGRRLEILVHQTLQLRLGSVAAGASEGRRQVIDDHGLGAALRLRPLAGIVDDERIEVWHRPQRRLGKAFRRERQRLARQPFQIAVLPHMHHRMGAEAIGEPGMEGEISMGRHQGRIVLGLDGIEVVAAGRLDRDDDIAETQRREREAAAVEIAGTEQGIALRRSPALGDALLRSRRQAREPGGVVVAPELLAAVAAEMRGGIGGARL